MILLRRLRAMLSEVMRRDTLDQAMDDEFRLHVDLLTEDLARRGIPRDDAERQARLAFGNLTVAKENGRAAKGLAWLDTLSQDVRFTSRTLRKNVGFTMVAILSLGFGIGAATTMFSVIDTLDFRPLPYAGGDRLVSLGEVRPANDEICARCDADTSPATARDWLSQVRSYEKVVVTGHGGMVWEHDDVEESLDVGLTTPGLLALVGLRPVVGRDIIDADTLPDASPVVVLTYEFWQTHFQRDPAVVGRQLRVRLGGIRSQPQTITVVGVAPKEFRVIPFFKLWRAMPLRETESRQAREATVIAKLRPGISIASAAAELRTVAGRIASLHAAEYQGWGANVVPLRDRLGWMAGRSRNVLFAVTLSVLLIAVLNVAGLLFNRAAAREQEFAMRAALGAGRMRLFRQLLVEGSCIGILGGLIGVAVAFGGVRIAAQWFNMADAGLSLAVDHRMIAFATLVSLVVGAGAAVAPAFRTARTSATTSTRPRATAGTRVSNTSSVLIAAQIALAFVLLTVATLLSHDFLALRYLDIGYDPRGLFATQISGARDQWLNPEPWKSLAMETRARVAAIRGIESATLLYQSGVHPEIVRPEAPRQSVMPNGRLQAVDVDFFSTWKSPLLLGRAFTAGDRAGTSRVAMVNRTAASEFWHGENPLGRRVFVGDSATAGEWLTVVGVAEDIEGSNFARRHGAIVYRPLDQAKVYHASMQISVRSADGHPEALVAAQAVIRKVTGRRSDAFESEENRLGMRYRTRRFDALALDLFAGFALLLAAMGIYGSISFAVTQRTREIGIRVALGAARANVLALIARRGVLVTAAGAAIGLVASLAVTRIFSSMVSATSVTNPWIIVGSVFVVLGVSVFATLLPARRATVVNPVIALRAE